MGGYLLVDFGGGGFMIYIPSSQFTPPPPVYPSSFYPLPYLSLNPPPCLLKVGGVKKKGGEDGTTELPPFPFLFKLLLGGGGWDL